VLNHKGWRKTTWVKFSASPAANTNQIVIEGVLQVLIKVTQNVKSTSGEISVKKQQKTVGKSIPMYRGWGEQLQR